MIWIWWTVAVLLVIAEMHTGTFYLLAIATSATAAGVAAAYGADITGQIGIAAILCTMLVFAVQCATKNISGNSNFQFDVNQQVSIVEWTDVGCARVYYRGAEWNAELSADAELDITRKIWNIKEFAGSIVVIY